MTTIEPFTPTTTPKSWGDEILVAHVPPDIRGRAHGGYTGKVLKRYADPEYRRGGLQFHTSKDETFYLVSGEVIVYFVDATGQLRKHEMHPGASFHVPPGAVHSVQTITDSVMLEVSTPVFDDRTNVEDKYNIEEAVEWP